MNIEMNQMSVICAGCLSSDRKLTKLSRGSTKEIFFELVHSIEMINKSVQLCWECIALVKKLFNFRNQVRIAQEHLHRQTFHRSSLSKLRISQTHTQHVTQISEDISAPIEKTTQDITKTLSEPQTNNSNSATLLSNNIVQNIKYEINIEHINSFNKNELINNSTDHPNTPVLKDSPNYISNNQNSYGKFSKLNHNYLDLADPKTKVCEVEPLAFIKVEESESEDFNDDLQDFYVDEPLEQRELDGKDLKDLKSDVENKTRFKLKRTRRNTKQDDFNESDDEPLEKKKTEKINKRGRKKKEVGEKIDRRKNPGPKREKPAGVVNNARVRKKLQQLNVESGLLDMVILSWEEVDEERQRALNSEVFTRHEYRCYDCVLGFNHKFKLDNHMKKHDPSSGSAACSVCRVRCRDAHALAAHRRRHRLRWSCTGCGGRWSRATVAADHLSRAHGAPPPEHACPQCPHRAPTLAKLRNHLKSHGERQKCELCGKTFRDRTSLRTHLFIHKGEKEYECPQCGKRFLFKKAMQVHLVTHDAPAHLYCHQCDMNFKNRMSYYQHMKYNLKHIDPDKLKFACQLCDKRFLKAIRLEEHNLAVHLKCTPIRCAVPGCNFACSSRPVLRTHTRMVHRGGRARRDHVCHTCGKAYTTKKTLEGHMRSHTGERPFKCAECPSTFGYEAALYNHNKLVHLKPKSGRARIPHNTSNPSTIPPTIPITVLPTVSTTGLSAVPTTVQPTILLTVPSSTCATVHLPASATGAATIVTSWPNIAEQTTNITR